MSVPHLLLVIINSQKEVEMNVFFIVSEVSCVIDMIAQ